MFEKEDVEKFTKYLNKYGNNFHKIRRAKRYKKYSLKQIWLLYARTISGDKSISDESCCNPSIRKINKIHDINIRTQKMVWSITVEENGRLVSYNKLEHRLDGCYKCRMLMIDYHYDLRRQMVNSREWFKFFNIRFGQSKRHQNKNGLTGNAGAVNDLDDAENSIKNAVNYLSLKDDNTTNNGHVLTVGCKSRKENKESDVIECSDDLHGNKNMTKTKLKKNDLSEDKKKLKPTDYDIKMCSTRKSSNIIDEDVHIKIMNDAYDVQDHINDS